MCCYLISTASLMDNGCLGIQGFNLSSQPAEGTTLKKPGLQGMFPASQPGAPKPGTRNCNTDWVSVREK